MRSTRELPLVGHITGAIGARGLSDWRHERVILVAEALFGGFYVTVTRSLFIVMLSYNDFTLSEISIVVFFSAVTGAFLSYVLYNRPNLISGRMKPKLLGVHFAERIFWMSLPFMIWDWRLTSLAYAAAVCVSVVVGTLINSVIMSIPNEGRTKYIFSRRSAVSSASALLAGFFMSAVLAIFPSIDGYFIAYLSAGFTGLTSTALLIFLNVPEVQVPEKPRPKLDIEAETTTTFLFLSIMFTGGGLIGIAWIPYLKYLGAPSYLAGLLSFFGSLGGILGSYLLTTYGRHRVAVLLNTAITFLIPFIAMPQFHPVLSFLMSASFVGANLMALSIYSSYVKELGASRASVMISAATLIGTAMASIAGMLLRSPLLLLILAGAFKAVAALLVIIAIPETTLLSKPMALGYARLIRSISIFSYTLMMETSRQAIVLLIRIVAMAVIVMLMYLIYKLAFLLC